MDYQGTKKGTLTPKVEEVKKEGEEEMVLSMSLVPGVQGWDWEDGSQVEGKEGIEVRQGAADAGDEEVASGEGRQVGLQEGQGTTKGTLYPQSLYQGSPWRVREHMKEP